MTLDRILDSLTNATPCIFGIIFVGIIIGAVYYMNKQGVKEPSDES